MSPLAVPWLHRLLPVFGRRLVVVDPGRRFIKVLVVDRGVPLPRVVHFQTITASPTARDSAGEMDEQLETVFAAAGTHERVLVLPQYRAIAQVVQPVGSGPVEAQASLLREARRLSGLEESALAFNARPIKPFGRWQNPNWLTLCKREELDSLLGRFGSAPEGTPVGADGPLLAEITTSAQALFAAAHVLGPAGRNCVMVDLRANNSVVALVADGQGVATSTIPTGSLQFQAATATSPPAGSPGPTGATAASSWGSFDLELVRPALQKWVSEIRLVVTEWLEDNPECGLSLAGVSVFLCGVGATQPGLIEVLNSLGPLHFVAWEERVTAGRPWPMADYLVPFGAALLALQRTPAGASLLPAEDRNRVRRRRLLGALQSVNVGLLLLVLGLMSFSIWQKGDLIRRKERVVEHTRQALQTALAIDQAYRQLTRSYAEVRPVLERQRQTVETLQSLAAMRAARTNDDFWYVLFADADTYATGRVGIYTGAPPPVRTPAATNPPPLAPREYVLEVCVPHDGEKQRRILSDLVANLKRDVLFRRVDALPPERNRDWLPTNVYVSNRVFALAMEIAGNELPPLVPPTSPPAATREPARTTSRPVTPGTPVR